MPAARHFLGHLAAGDRAWRDHLATVRAHRHPPMPQLDPGTGPLPPPDTLYHVHPDGTVDPDWLDHVLDHLPPSVGLDLERTIKHLGGMAAGRSGHEQAQRALMSPHAPQAGRVARLLDECRDEAAARHARTAGGDTGEAMA